MAQWRFSPQSLSRYICSGATNGFRCHETTPLRGFHYTTNYASALRDAPALTEALRGRLAAGKTVGPLPWDPSSVPADVDLCVNPLAAIRYKLEPDRCRPIDDPHVNSNLYAPYFPMPSFELLRTMATPGCWFGTQDVRSAFPCLPLHPDMWHYFAVAWLDLSAPQADALSAAMAAGPPGRPLPSRLVAAAQESLYVHTHGLFGPRDLPYIWTMYMLFVTMVSVELGIALTVPYLDDVTHLHDHRPEVALAMDRYGDLLADLGTPEKLLKRTPPFQKGEILGRHFNSRTFTVSVPRDKMARFSRMLRGLLSLAPPTVRDLESFLGLAAFIASVLPPYFGSFISPFHRLLRKVTRRGGARAPPHHRVRLDSAGGGAETRAAPSTKTIQSHATGHRPSRPN